MSKFVRIVLFIYIIYYIVMIVFDLFIKKSIGDKKTESATKLEIEGFQTEDVEITEEDIEIEEKLREKENDQFEDEEDPEPVNQQEIQFEVEGQGFTLDEFAQVMTQVHNEGISFMDRIENQSIKNAEIK